MSFSKRIGASALSFILAVSLGFAFPGISFAQDQIEGEEAPSNDVSEEMPSSGASEEVGGSAYMTDAEIEAFIAQSDEATAQALAEQADEIGTLSIEPLESSNTIEYSGGGRYETSALQAMSGWTAAGTVVLASGTGWPDALAASGLAGALDAPVLLTPATGLDSYVADALLALGTEEVIIVGGTGVVSDNVISDLEVLGITQVTRLAGADRLQTQVEIFKYGLEKNLWSSDGVIVASSANESFADVLSASPVAFSRSMPVFLVNSEGVLTDDQMDVLIEAAQNHVLGNAVVIGGTARVSERTMGVFDALSLISTGSHNATERIAGANRFATSAQVAQWAIANGWLHADGAAFSSAVTPFDALGGGALQGKLGSVLLLVADGATRDATNALSQAGGVTTIRFFGGTASLSDAVRMRIEFDLGFISAVQIRDYAITIGRMAELQHALLVANPSCPQYSVAEIVEYLNPDNFAYGTNDFYQFAVLSDGYSGAVTADQLNRFIETQCVAAERSYGVTSKFRGMGQAFIDAARTWNVNEVYLLSHAALESAWGCSRFAQGTVEGGIGYYNFFGIRCYDSDPTQGALYAKAQGWDTPQKAIMGAAQWISQGYINSSTYDQDTLYKMKWNLGTAVNYGQVAHQYATGRSWACGIARVMDNFYSSAGISMDRSGLRFEVPRYAG